MSSRLLNRQTWFRFCLIILLLIKRSIILSTIGYLSAINYRRIPNDPCHMSHVTWPMCHEVVGFTNRKETLDCHYNHIQGNSIQFEFHFRHKQRESFVDKSLRSYYTILVFGRWYSQPSSDPQSQHCTGYQSFDNCHLNLYECCSKRL